jgi:hypothetical protein
MVKVTSTHPVWHDGLVPIPKQTTFVIEGVTYELAEADRVGRISAVRTWPPNERPKVHATVTLQDGGTTTVYAEATAWNQTQIHVRWHDDNTDSLTTWAPKADVRPVTESEWDIDQYNRTPEWSRPIRWGHRMPGFLPE